MTTLFLPSGRVDFFSAMTLTCGLDSGGATTIDAVEPGADSATPSENEPPTTGMVIALAAGEERADDQALAQRGVRPG